MNSDSGQSSIQNRIEELKTDDPKTADLEKESREYLQEIGITDDEIEKLLVRIGKYDNPVKIS